MNKMMRKQRKENEKEREIDNERIKNKQRQ